MRLLPSILLVALGACATAAPAPATSLTTILAGAYDNAAQVAGGARIEPVHLGLVETEPGVLQATWRQGDADGRILTTERWALAETADGVALSLGGPCALPVRMTSASTFEARIEAEDCPPRKDRRLAYAASVSLAPNNLLVRQRDIDLDDESNALPPPPYDLRRR